MDIVVVDLSTAYGMLLSQKFSSSLEGTIEMDLSFTSIPNLDGRLVQIMRDPKNPFHVEKCSRLGNRVGRVVQVNHVMDPDANGIVLHYSFELGHLLNEEETILINEECPHLLFEEEIQRGQSQNNREIREAINQLEEVVTTLRRVAGGGTSSPNKNDTMLIDYLDPGPSTHPLQSIPHLDCVSKISCHKHPCVGIGIGEGDHTQHDPGVTQLSPRDVPEDNKEIVFEGPPKPHYKEGDLVYITEPFFCE